MKLDVTPKRGLEAKGVAGASRAVPEAPPGQIGSVLAGHPERADLRLTPSAAAVPADRQDHLRVFGQVLRSAGGADQRQPAATHPTRVERHRPHRRDAGHVGTVLREHVRLQAEQTPVHVEPVVGAISLGVELDRVGAGAVSRGPGVPDGALHQRRRRGVVDHRRVADGKHVEVVPLLRVGPASRGGDVVLRRDLEIGRAHV